MNIKGRTRIGSVFLGVAIGLFVLWVTSWALSNSDSSQPSGVLSKEKGEANNDDYWTSERLRKAKPLELPHPKGAEENLNGPLKQDPNEGPSSRSEEGSQGDPTIVPDTRNLLFAPVEPHEE